MIQGEGGGLKCLFGAYQLQLPGSSQNLVHALANIQGGKL